MKLLSSLYSLLNKSFYLHILFTLDCNNAIAKGGNSILEITTALLLWCLIFLSFNFAIKFSLSE